RDRYRPWVSSARMVVPVALMKSLLTQREVSAWPDEAVRRATRLDTALLFVARAVPVLLRKRRWREENDLPDQTAIVPRLACSAGGVVTDGEAEFCAASAIPYNSVFTLLTLPRRLVCKHPKTPSRRNRLPLRRRSWILKRRSTSWRSWSPRWK